LVRNRVPVRTLKFDFGVGILLGKGRSVVGTKRGAATEENEDVHAEREQ